nr:putative disease resistance protein rga4 [Quercus suber]
MPRLQRLSIRYCPRLKSLPNFLHTIPLQNLKMEWCPILKERCKRGTGEEWPKISHIPNIDFDPFGTIFSSSSDDEDSEEDDEEEDL